jgi:mRNA interferase RelE/StbE
MKIQFDEAFEKSIKKLKDKKTRDKLYDLILSFEDAKNLSEISNIKKMQGFQSYYRVRLGDYRVGFELLNDNALLFILVAHRKEIYKYFP